MRLHRNSNGMIYDGINLVQWTICRCLLSDVFSQENILSYMNDERNVLLV